MKDQDGGEVLVSMVGQYNNAWIHPTRELIVVFRLFSSRSPINLHLDSSTSRHQEHYVEKGRRFGG